MNRFFGFLKNYPDGKRKAISILGIVILLQVLDCATTKILVIINGGTDIESNPFARNIFDGFSRGVELFLILKLIVVSLLCLWFMRYRKSKFPLFDLTVNGIFIFGYLFVVLNNAVNLLIALFLVNCASWLPAVVINETAKNLCLIANHLVIGATFSLLGIYVWHRYRRLFCFGPVFVCLWVIVFTVINVL